jgi:hypothetical protein
MIAGGSMTAAVSVGATPRTGSLGAFDTVVANGTGCIGGSTRSVSGGSRRSRTVAAAAAIIASTSPARTDMFGAAADRRGSVDCAMAGGPQSSTISSVPVSGSNK